MADAFSQAQIEQLRSVFREELADAGLRIDGLEHQDEAREDFRFLRRLRRLWDNSVTRVGTIVLTALVGLALSIVGMGFWQWIGKGH